MLTTIPPELLDDYKALSAVFDTVKLSHGAVQVFDCEGRIGTYRGIPSIHSIDALRLVLAAQRNEFKAHPRMLVARGPWVVRVITSPGECRTQIGSGQWHAFKGNDPALIYRQSIVDAFARYYEYITS